MDPEQPAETTTVVAAPSPRLRDRSWSSRVLLLAAVAALVLGAVLGSWITLMADGHDHGGVMRVPPGPPGQQGYFYWNDGPRPLGPRRLRPAPLLGQPRGNIDQLEKRLRQRLAQLEQLKSATPSPTPSPTSP